MAPTRGRIPLAQARTPWFIGVDVGGTSCKLAVTDDDGQLLDYSSILTEEERGPADAVQRIKQALDQLLANLGIGWDRIAAVGLGTPGSQDLHRGWIINPPNMPHWRDFPIRDALAQACGKPCSYINDANAAAYGEFWVGTGREHVSMVMFTLGTGVGGGIILNGKLVNGVNSFGSELGHIIIDGRDDARLCVWGGGQGQLEAYASASAVVARAQEALDAGRSSSILRRVQAGEELTAKMLAEEAEKGDKFSLDIILETARYLGVGITTVVHTVDPGAVVIGGAMTFGKLQTHVGRLFLQKVREEFQARCYGVVAQTSIDYATLGGDAGMIGAAGIARADWHEAHRPPSPPAETRS